MKLARMCLFGVVLFAVAGCSEDVSSRPEYAGVMGHVFETKIDLILYALYSYESNGRVYVEIPGDPGVPKLSELPSEFPYESEGKAILGVLPAGSQFRVAGVSKSWGTLHGYAHDYELRILKPEQFKGRELCTTGLVTYVGPPPGGFDLKLVKEAPAK